MASSTSVAGKVLFLLGAGPKVGAAVTKKFSEAGYKIATSSRTTDAKHNEGGYHVPLDLVNPSAVAAAFDEVAGNVGIPDVVVYNAYDIGGRPSPTPLDIPVETYLHALNVNHTSVFAAIKAAVGKKKDVIFIYTGNGLNTLIKPHLLALGLGKTASAYLLETVSRSYGGQGARFYYADERHADGTFMSEGVDGPSHADFFLSLAQSTQQLPLQATFVNGKYVQF